MAQLLAHKWSGGTDHGGQIRRSSLIEKTACVFFRRDQQFDMPPQLGILGTCLAAGNVVRRMRYSYLSR